MTPKHSFLERIGRFLARVIMREVRCYEPYALIDLDALRSSLEPGDVILVDGNQWLSVAIKYLTQSTWSHAAFYVGDAMPPADGETESRSLIEVDLEKGCHAVALSKYQPFNLRICRPIAITLADRARAVQYMVDQIGTQYDLKNIVDLARYLLPTPPVPVRWRRRMLSLGSGTPTQAICSSLIAKAFQSVRYPILPHVETTLTPALGTSGYSRTELYYIRHSSLFTPRDFDISPYFTIVKPTIHREYGYKALTWAEDDAPPPPSRC